VKHKDKGRLPQFVPLLHSTIDSTAWRAMSHGAKSLYVALKRRVPRGRNQAYVSHRQAVAELKSSRRKIAEWFDELEHYGFIVLAQHGCLGVDGKGKSPHWRLTELGNNSKATADGLSESPTRDFLKWDGVLFERQCKKQNPGSYGGTIPVPAGEPVVVPTWEPLQTESGSHGVAIEETESGSYVRAITSLTTMGALPTGSKEPSKTQAPRITRDRHEDDTSLQTKIIDDPRVQSLARWGEAATRKAWSKPTILSDEPRDLSEFPADDMAA